MRSISSALKNGTICRRGDVYAVLPLCTMIGCANNPAAAARSISRNGRANGIAQVPKTTNTTVASSSSAAPCSKQRADEDALRIDPAHLLPLHEEQVGDRINRGRG